MERRKALQILAAGAAAAGLSALNGCNKSQAPQIDLNDPTVGKMTYRTNPKNGDKISLLGYGCMRFPTLGDDKSAIDEEMAQILVDEAIRRGVNYFDTAWPYHGGNSELFIGKALKKYPRDSFYLASKFPGMRDMTKEEFLEVFPRQLEKCQVEYFDYYMLHNLQNVQDFKKTYEEKGMLNYLLEQKKQGKIRNLGWSFHGDIEMFNYVLGLDVEWDFALIQINYMDWDVAPDISKRKWANENTVAPNAQWMYEKLTERGIPVIIMEPLLGGRLARLNREALTLLKTEKPEDPAARWAFRFVGQLPNVLTVLSGMTYMEHLVENARTYSPLAELTEREMTALMKAAEAQRGKHTINCTTCRYCMPCPYGIDIPSIFAHYNKCVAEENIPPDAMDPDYARARRAYLVSYDRALPDLRQADKCVGCKRCIPLCPQMIEIPTEMQRLAKLVESLR
ncbi:MAG: aldo/keto reductase [Proteobacteria bacterium]|nr:aldo/keto reductase [Pseudomonadota bacterium]